LTDSRAVCGAAGCEAQGLTAGHFSFNVPGGRCNTCEGDGTVTVEMQFLADVELPCEECNGTRYKANAGGEVQGQEHPRSAEHDGEGGAGFFAGHPKIVDKLAVLDEVGLGYVRLGQSATTLSGGEAQRVKLAAHLAQVQGGPNATAGRGQARGEPGALHSGRADDGAAL
jgi:excinuclease ABC subunit A